MVPLLSLERLEENLKIETLLSTLQGDRAIVAEQLAALDLAIVTIKRYARADPDPANERETADDTAEPVKGSKRRRLTAGEKKAISRRMRRYWRQRRAE